MRLRDDECFGADMDEGMDTDFDFEANLALFDKAAVFSQIDGTDCNGARSRGTPGGERGTPTRYRHDENILEVKPVVYRQITVPQHGGKEYCTGKRETTQHPPVAPFTFTMGESTLLHSHIYHTSTSRNLLP